MNRMPAADDSSRLRSIRVVLANTGWLLFDRGIRLVLGVTVGVLVARHLGPTSFGILNYVLAISGVLSPAAEGGVNSIVVRQLVARPDDAASILSASVTVQLLTGIAAAVVLVAIGFLSGGAVAPVGLYLLVSFMLCFRWVETIRYWFESRARVRALVIAENLAILLASLFRVMLVALGGALLWFGAAVGLEALLVVVLMLFVFARAGARPTLSISVRGATSLLRESWPLIVSALAVMLYMRVDSIMLGHLVGASAVGQYAAALRFSEVWYMIPMTLVASAFPGLVSLHAEGGRAFGARIRQVLAGLMVFSFAVCAGTWLAADTAIAMTFGDHYASAADILRVHVLALPFVALGVIGDRWYVLHGLQKISMARFLVGLALNITLNFALIPEFGGLGAAYATLVSQAASSWLLDMVSARTRPLFFIKARSLVFWIGDARGLLHSAIDLLRGRG